MFILIIYILSLFNLTYTNKCSLKNPIKYERIYLCREKLNSTSIRIWLHLKLNKTNLNELNFFSYYSFTLRIIDLLEEGKLKLHDRFEKSITNYVQFNKTHDENNTINIHNLLAGRYEICVNFLNKINQKFYYRSTNSCLHIPWHVPENEIEHSTLVMKLLFLVLIILLFVAIAFLMYSIHQFRKSRKPLPPSPPLPEPLITENTQEKDIHTTEHARHLVNQHFGQNVNPFELLVRKRIHQRYAHRSPDMNDTYY